MSSLILSPLTTIPGGLIEALASSFDYRGMAEGLSPLPVFGINIPYTDSDVGKQLAVNGFGVFTHLYLAVHPESLQGELPPEQIQYGPIPRPVAQAPIRRLPDGSLTIGSNE